MHATQVLAHPLLQKNPKRAERLPVTLSNRGDYARRLVETLADVTHSQYAIWLNLARRSRVRGSGDRGLSFPNRVLSLCACVPSFRTMPGTRERDPFRGRRAHDVSLLHHRRAGSRQWRPALHARRSRSATRIGRAAVLEYETPANVPKRWDSPRPAADSRSGARIAPAAGNSGSLRILARDGAACRRSQGARTTGGDAKTTRSRQRDAGRERAGPIRRLRSRHPGYSA